MWYNYQDAKNSDTLIGNATNYHRLKRYLKKLSNQLSKLFTVKFRAT